MSENDWSGGYKSVAGAAQKPILFLVSPKYLNKKVCL